MNKTSTHQYLQTVDYYIDYDIENYTKKESRAKPNKSIFFNVINYKQYFIEYVSTATPTDWRKNKYLNSS